MPAHRSPPLRALVLAVAAGVTGASPSAGQWVEDPGSGWLHMGVHHHDTRNEYGPSGHPRPFFAGGHARTTSVFLTGVVGVARGLDSWLQLPFHRLRFDDAGGERTRTGIGDPRIHLRAGPELLGIEGPAVALRTGVKLAGSEFPVDPEVIPLTEGQRDWEVILEVGRSFHPLPLYGMAWAGYRWRERDRERARDPGDERLLMAALGGELPPAVTWKLALEGLWGRAPRITDPAVGAQPAGRIGPGARVVPGLGRRRMRKLRAAPSRPAGVSRSSPHGGPRPEATRCRGSRRS